MQTFAVSARVDQEFLRYFRCTEEDAEFQVSEESFSSTEGFFRFGSDLICYGRTVVDPKLTPDGELPDVLPKVFRDEGTCVLPFNPTEIAANLRFERYSRPNQSSIAKRAVRQAYYLIRPLLPVRIRRHLQRRWLKGWASKSFPTWPVDTTVDRMFTRLMHLKLQTSPGARIPFIWFWPENKMSCAIMTHDVETLSGLDSTNALMGINDSFGIKSSFQLIPDARYRVTPEIVEEMKQKGFEVNVHDLKHDGHLFDTAESFEKSALRINDFAVQFGSKGFRSGALYRNQNWYYAFQFSYDMSVPNCGHLDPQPGGCCTVMPYFVGNILEIPVTATQDYSLFNIIGTYSQDLWREQIRQISEHHGLISFIVHPDYLDRPAATDAYTTLLSTLSTLRAESQLWIVLPGDVDTWWRQRSEMKLVRVGDSWKVEGAGSSRASVAYAVLQDGKLSYTFS